MTEQEIINIMRNALWTGVWIGAPMIGVALVVGVVVGLFQALTSIQEATLTFAPKLIVLVLVFWVSAGYMARSLKGLFENVVLPIVAGG